MQRGMMMQFDKLPLPVYVLRTEADASGLPQDFIFVYANSACASFLGIDGKNYLLGMSFSDIWGDNGAKWLNIYTKTALEGLNQNVEDYNENLKKYLSVDCYQPMYGYCGCFMRDVTQRREMEQQQELKEALVAAHTANEAKSAFLSQMSHDIRTPMNAIIGMTTIARQNIENKVKTLDCLNKIGSSSAHLLELINSILSMSKIESGKVILTDDELSLPQLLEDVLNIIRPMAGKKMQNLRLELEELKHAEVLTDSTHLKQILLNVLGNAVKYTPEGGEIVLGLQELSAVIPQRSQYVFTVSDNGPGLSEELLPKIFDMFERGEDSRTSKIEGTGLGLAICKNLTNLMAGTIEAANRPEGGAKFTLTLPLRWLGDDAVKPLPAVKPAGRSDFSGHRVLIVEDNDLNMEIALEFLQSLGLVCEGAENGRRAVEMFNASAPGHYEMILMDVRMPVMNGYEATREIRRLAREDARQIPIVAMTADAFSSDIKMALNAGMNEHLSKPVSIERLQEVLGQWL